MQHVLPSRSAETGTSFCHEAFLYSGFDEFVTSSAAFIRDGLAAGDAILVVVPAPKIDALREELGRSAGDVCFANMADVGFNPARIIPAWQDFVDEHAGDGAGLRGIGEPIGPDRDAAQLSECHRHEALLNLAFHDTPSFWLRCPYDRTALDPAVIEEAERNHPVVSRRGARESSATYTGLDAVRAPFAEPLPAPPGDHRELAFQGDMLGTVRGVVARHAALHSLGMPESQDLLLSVSELAANSLRHGGGTGLLRVWHEEDAVICEVADAGTLDRPLAGRERPQPGQVGGYGLWLANQLCDLVQVRSTTDGTVVRVRMGPRT
jgi:anti-sigma regulatory factor (Ser/Thr protein kinase)